VGKTVSLENWLNSQAQEPVPPLLCIFTDEPLFQTQAADLYRSKARAQKNCLRQVIDVDKTFNDSHFLGLFSEMSLFGDLSLIDLRMPQPKLSKEVAAALDQVCEWIKTGQSEHLLLVTGPRLNKTQQASAGFNKLLSVGMEVVCPDIQIGNMPQWIVGAGRRLNLKVDNASAKWLAERTEGNLLAAHQTLEKLAVQHQGTVNLEQIQQGVSDSARFNVFELSPALLSGGQARIIRMLEGLQAEGEAPTLVLWALMEDIRALRNIKLALHKGISLGEACKQNRIWGPRQNLIGPTERKHTLESLQTLTDVCFQAEKTIKGLRAGDAWTLLEMIGLGIAGVRPLSTME
jgi:DNA polymerase III subunit delta